MSVGRFLVYTCSLLLSLAANGQSAGVYLGDLSWPEAERRYTETPIVGPSSPPRSVRPNRRSGVPAANRICAPKLATGTTPAAWLTTITGPGSASRKPAGGYTDPHGSSSHCR